MTRWYALAQSLERAADYARLAPMDDEQLLMLVGFLRRLVEDKRIMTPDGVDDISDLLADEYVMQVNERMAARKKEQQADER